MSTRAGTAALALAAGRRAGFLALPLVALFAEAPLRDVPELLRPRGGAGRAARDAETNLLANALILGFGTPPAWVLATRALPRPQRSW